MVAFRLLSFALLASAVAAQNILRYMPLGDSITEAVCWRALLWEKLQSTEFASVDWVGSSNLIDNNCGNTRYDRDSEGHSGFLAINIANSGQLVGWLQANPADVVTMHLGTNDIGWLNPPVDQILATFTRLVGVMRDSNPKIKIIVAQIIPSTNVIWNTAITNLNQAIPAWAQGLNKTESPIWVVDQNTGIDPVADLRDGLHPNLAGDEKMANVWYPGLINALRAAKTDKLAEADAAAATADKDGDGFKPAKVTKNNVERSGRIMLCAL
ncbi:carbohydrate esterase family 3 protein [Xylaria bambusicola]|uniref:carbohydrate esterase family 3 protein n=1 Tax=Xylaria bambusicola TaxID=326684 RepID=UPI002007D22F|nr:carbohydrate esterase family 3 protein [Xylaria bambusicola]KAI0517822.1 carbohydrate esterase family 3 protein [Xylaria bambusicola]